MKKINPQIEKAVEDVEKKIDKVLISNIDPPFYEIVRHQMKTGGKKMRPVLAYASCKMLGGKERNIAYAAAGLELLHNCSLIVDDIIDNSTLRRGKTTVWAKFGRSIAQCISIDYAATAFEAASRAKNPKKISEIFAKTFKVVMEGEVMDILFEQVGREEEPYINKNRKLSVKEEDVFKMIKQKTATLIEASCEAGGVSADATKEQIAKLKRYGFNVGMAFQVSDDLLDIFGKEEKFGKKIGKDIEERKGGNCVIYFASQEFSLEQKNKFWEILRKKKLKKEDIKEAIKMIEKTNAKEKAIQYGKSFIKKAEKSLSSLPSNEWRDFLFELSGIIMKRER